MANISVQSLHYYPVKSLAGHSPQSWTLEKRGFKDDRRWMFVDTDGNFMSQRRYPQIVHWKASVDGNDLLITDRRDEQNTFRIAAANSPDRPHISVTLWNDKFEACWVDDPIVEELVVAMGISGARLVYMAEEQERPVDPEYAAKGDIVSLADGFPYLITNTASLADANEKMGEEMAMTRFRPNIVLKTDQAWAEDDWTALEIGNASFRTPKPCARCKLITVNQETGEQRIELLGELGRFRRVGRKILFGTNAIWDGGEAVISVGDSVSL